MKWYKKLLFQIIDPLVPNSYILFKNQKHQNLQHWKFKLKTYSITYWKVRLSKKAHIVSRLSVHPLALIVRYLPSLVPSYENKQTHQIRCYVCRNTERRAKERSDTFYQCTQCDVELCIIDCSKYFHTVQKIWRYLVQTCKTG